MSNSRKYMDSCGRYFSTVRDMCAFHDVSVKTYQSRRYAGCTVEQALTKDVVKHIDHCGRLFSTVRDMCAFHNVSVKTYQSRRYAGCTVEQALTGDIVKQTTPIVCNDYKDHKGNEFPSIKAMCEYYGVNDATYYNRLKRGCTLEQALTGSGLKQTTPITCKDHKDNEFPSVRVMCKYYGINDSVYYARLKQGYTLEQILTGNGVKRTTSVACKDHKDNEFPSVKAMCKHYGITDSKYYARLNMGCTLEQALTGSGLKQTASIICKDHNGMEFPSVSAMCKHHGVNTASYYTRLKKGCTLEQALLGKGTKQDTRYRYYDHEGNGFTSLEGMCSFHGVAVSSYRTRRRQGYTLEQALSSDAELERHTDHNGRVFDTIDAMCKHYNIVRATYYLRLQKGYTKEQALTGKKPSKDI